MSLSRQSNSNRLDTSQCSINAVTVEVGTSTVPLLNHQEMAARGGSGCPIDFLGRFFILGDAGPVAG